MRATFLVPVAACWLLILLSRAGHRLHGAGPRMVLLVTAWIIWAGFVTWRIAMNEHASSTADASARVDRRSWRP